MISTGAIVVTMKIIDKTKFDDLEDSNKIFGIVSIMATTIQDDLGYIQMTC